MKIIQFWFSLTLFSITIYAPFYFFSNNALDSIEEATIPDLLPFIVARGTDIEKMIERLESMGIDVNKSLDSALDDNPKIASYKIEYRKDRDSEDIKKASGLTAVNVHVVTDNGFEIDMIYLVREKEFLREVTRIEGLLSFTVGRGQTVMSIAPRDMIADLGGLFASDEKNASEVVSQLELKLQAQNKASIRQ